jgi:AraC-like DNA-binding protein
VERAGVPRECFLRATKLDPELLEAPDGRVLRSELFTYCETALDLTQDPGFGLHWAEWISANTFNLVSHLLAHAATLRQAFDSLFQFGDLVTDQLNIRIVEDGDEIELRRGHVTSESLRIRRLAAEMSMLGLFRMLRDFSPQAGIRRVNFEYAAPSYCAEYARVFESTERFAQPFTGLVFSRALLDLPSPHKDPDIQSTLRALAEQRVSRIRQGAAPYWLRIREHLTQQAAPHRVGMNAVAQCLELSLRTLHRRLADEGKSYTAIANEASASVAKRLLIEEQRTIQEVAFAMGFADASAFHRAFKRWTGTTPMQARGNR